MPTIIEEPMLAFSIARLERQSVRSLCTLSSFVFSEICKIEVWRIAVLLMHVFCPHVTASVFILQFLYSGRSHKGT